MKTALPPELSVGQKVVLNDDRIGTTVHRRHILVFMDDIVRASETYGEHLEPLRNFIEINPAKSFPRLSWFKSGSPIMWERIHLSPSLTHRRVC